MGVDGMGVEVGVLLNCLFLVLGLMGFDVCVDEGVFIVLCLWILVGCVLL